MMKLSAASPWIFWSFFSVFLYSIPTSGQTITYAFRRDAINMKSYRPINPVEGKFQSHLRYSAQYLIPYKTSYKEDFRSPYQVEKFLQKPKPQIPQVAIFYDGSHTSLHSPVQAGFIYRQQMQTKFNAPSWLPIQPLSQNNNLRFQQAHQKNAITPFLVTNQLPGEFVPMFKNKNSAQEKDVRPVKKDEILPLEPLQFERAPDHIHYSIISPGQPEENSNNYVHYIEDKPLIAPTINEPKVEITTFSVEGNYQHHDQHNENPEIRSEIPSQENQEKKNATEFTEIPINHYTKQLVDLINIVEPLENHDKEKKKKKSKPIKHKHQTHDTYDEYDDTESNDDIPNNGRAGIDYPNFHKIPETKFKCNEQRYKGFFGDPDTGCQVWHYCDLNGGKASFLCPNGTIFSQSALTCDWWFNVKCSSTPQLYVLNERLYKFILPFVPKFPEDYSGPIVDDYLTIKFQEMAKNNENKAKIVEMTDETNSETLLNAIEFKAENNTQENKESNSPPTHPTTVEQVKVNEDSMEQGAI